jgi:hypothetical protein
MRFGSSFRYAAEYANQVSIFDFNMRPGPSAFPRPDCPPPYTNCTLGACVPVARRWCWCWCWCCGIGVLGFSVGVGVVLWVLVSVLCCGFVVDVLMRSHVAIAVAVAVGLQWWLVLPVLAVAVAIHLDGERLAALMPLIA